MRIIEGVVRNGKLTHPTGREEIALGEFETRLVEIVVHTSPAGDWSDEATDVANALVDFKRTYYGGRDAAG